MVDWLVGKAALGSCSLGRVAHGSGQAVCVSLYCYASAADMRSEIGCRL